MDSVTYAESDSSAAAAVGRADPRRLLPYLDIGIAVVAILVAVAASPLRSLSAPRAQLSHVLVLALTYLVLGLLLFREGRYSLPATVRRSVVVI